MKYPNLTNLDCAFECGGKIILVNLKNDFYIGICTKCKISQFVRKDKIDIKKDSQLKL